ncbi:MAG TPA: glycoside hydrolase family 6 protein [Nocardioides sp.]|nr:glycoside hydrolase family 6 protein [Nocardioides sp.]
MNVLRPRRARVAVLCALVAALLTAYAGPLVARPADAAARAVTDPLAGGPWGPDTTDSLASDYAAATGTTRTLLGSIAGQPRVRWFTPGLATPDVATRITRYIRAVQAGDPDVLVPIALFRIFPRGEAHRDEPMTAAEIADYRAWMAAAANAIGSTRAVVVMEPDLAELAPPNRSTAPVVPDARVRSALVKAATHQLSLLPRTTVYLDAGDADWLPIDKATGLLVRSGIEYARGFALGATHYSPTGSDLTYAKSLEQSLALAGTAYAGKSAVLDTADNGRGFTWGYWHTHQARLGDDFDNARVCATPTTTLCVTLGAPPTWDVGPTWAPYVDAYLWFGRPWLTRQASPYNQKRALGAARTTPYVQQNVTGATGP